ISSSGRTTQIRRFMSISRRDKRGGKRAGVSRLSIPDRRASSRKKVPGGHKGVAKRSAASGGGEAPLLPLAAWRGAPGLLPYRSQGRACRLHQLADRLPGVEQVLRPAVGVG